MAHVNVHCTRTLDNKIVPTVQIDLASAAPAYEQIAAGMRALLVSGDFRPGDTLPTVRQLARDLRVHHNTVAEAYRVLADEGWLDLKRRRGARVLSRRRPAASEEIRRDFGRRLDRLVAEAIAKGISEAAVRRHFAAAAKKLMGNASKASPRIAVTPSAGRP